METVIYTVRKGDTLYSLAKKYGTTVNMLSRFNNIPDPDVIYEGQTLRIPVSEIPEIQRREQGRATTDHIVKPGETLHSIASSYGISHMKLAGFNSLAAPFEIVPGQVLRIPLSYVPVKPSFEYTVKKGDTLAKLAEQYGTSVMALAGINRISDPDVILEGQVIRIPAAMPDPEPDEDPQEGRLEYTVKSGDTLYKIACRFGVSVSYLINLNRLTEPDRIYPDQVIVIRE